ncbi:MAG: choice-of-anchor D domain-containing protein, partial [Chryseolinea sp.]
MKTPSFRFRSTIIFVFLFASFFHLRVYANLTDDSPPDLTIEVTGDFDFGSVFFGTQPSQPRQFVIRNIGQEMVTFNVTVSNPDFTYFSDASLTLWPGDSALSYIAFKPSVVGVISGTLTITSNDPVSPVLNFNMAGVGLTSPVEETLIQDTVIELTTTIRPFKITNTSNERSEFHLEAFSGNFVQFPIDTYFLDPGESVWAELRFTGYNYIGIEQAVFQLSHLSIQGIALDPIFITVKLVTLETPWGPFAYVPGGRDIDFGRAFVGSTAGPIVFEIINPSPTPLICHLSSSDINFWIDGPDTTFIVTRDDFFSSSYSFKPLTVGDFSGEILLTTNDPNHPTFLWHVHGEGMDTPFQLVEDTIQVGEQSIQTVTIRNTASVPLSFTLSAERNDEHDSFLELLITPNTIALAPDETATFQVVVDATDFIPGVYYGSIEGNPGQYDRFKVPFILTVVDLPQDIELPDSIIVEVPVGTIQSSSFVIQNTGNTNLNYSIETGSIESGNGSRLYSTGFEEFDLSSIQFMGGWYAADYIYFSSGSPGQVANENPFSGSKHLRYVSSEGEKLFSPISNTSASDISIVDMMIDFEPGVTWKIAAKDHYFSGAGNALVIHPDGSMSVETDFPSDELHSIPGTLPEGYFNLRFSIKKSTQEFSIAVNGDVMYTGPSHISDFSQVVFLGGLEQYGKNLDIDDLRIIVGDEERSFLSAVPSSGTIPPLGSQTVNLLIDAH